MARRTQKKWLQRARARMERKGTVGSFTAWCKRKGFKGVTQKCIELGLKCRDPKIRKKAAFAKAACSIAKKRKRKK